VAGNKMKIDSDGLAKALWESTVHFSERFHDELLSKIAGTKYQISEEDDMRLIKEILMLNLWAISKILRTDVKALDALHDIYLHGHRGLTKSDAEAKELMEDAHITLLARYDRYYKVWDDSQGSNQMIFGGTATEFLLCKDTQANMNFNIVALVLTHTFGVMKAVHEIRDGMEVVDVAA
jgi:hypothetical protein